MKKIIKYLIISFIVLVVGALIIRMIISADKTTFDDFVVSDASAAAYADGELDVLTVKMGDKMSVSGYFCVYAPYFVRETGEVQITVRYNESAFTYTDTESDADFDFVLLSRSRARSALDVKPGEALPEETIFERFDGKYYTASKIETAEKYGLYRFEKLTFEGVEFPADPKKCEFWVVMVPAGTKLPAESDDLLTKQDAYESFFDYQGVHFLDSEWRPYKLTKKNIAELKG